MFKALILQGQHNLSDARMAFIIRDRLSWMQVLGFDLGAPTPDENTIRHFRNRLSETGTLKRVTKAFDWQLQKKGYIPVGGQACPGHRSGIVDASLAPSPKQRNTQDEKTAIRAAVEHVCARQKTCYGLFIRTIGLARAEAKLTLANIACNFDRLILHERRPSAG
jgi:IS5 family transposase